MQRLRYRDYFSAERPGKFAVTTDGDEVAAARAGPAGKPDPGEHRWDTTSPPLRRHRPVYDTTSPPLRRHRPASARE